MTKLIPKSWQPSWLPAKKALLLALAMGLFTAVQVSVQMSPPQRAIITHVPGHPLSISTWILSLHSVSFGILTPTCNKWLLSWFVYTLFIILVGPPQPIRLKLYHTKTLSETPAPGTLLKSKLEGYRAILGTVLSVVSLSLPSASLCHCLPTTCGLHI